MKIPFSPPDITEAEIQEVTDALKSGWQHVAIRKGQLPLDLQRPAWK